MVSQTVAGTWHDGVSTHSLQVTVSRNDQNLIVAFDDQRIRRWPLRQLKLSARIAGIPLSIRMDDNSLVTIPDGDFARDIASYSGLSATIEARLLRLLPAMLLGTAAVLYVLFAFVIPRIGLFVVDHMDVSTINAIGDKFFEQMAYRVDLVDEPRYVDAAAELTAIGQRLLAQRKPSDSEDYAYRFLVPSGKNIGVNALALPHGHIVMSYKLYEKLNTEEITAVLAHEIGHVEMRHSMQSIGRAGAWYLIVNLLSPDFGLIYLPLLLSETSYSRANERQADCYSAQLLQQIGIHPSALITALDKITTPKDKYETTEEQDEPLNISVKIINVLSTHPLYEDRKNNIYTCSDLPGPP